MSSQPTERGFYQKKEKRDLSHPNYLELRTLFEYSSHNPESSLLLNFHNLYTRSERDLSVIMINSISHRLPDSWEVVPQDFLTDRCSNLSHILVEKPQMHLEDSKLHHATIYHQLPDRMLSDYWSIWATTKEYGNNHPTYNENTWYLQRPKNGSHLKEVQIEKAGLLELREQLQVDCGIEGK